MEHYVTFTELFQFVIMVTGIVTAVFMISKEILKHKNNKKK